MVLDHAMFDWGSGLGVYTADEAVRMLMIFYMQFQHPGGQPLVCAV